MIKISTVLLTLALFPSWSLAGQNSKYSPQAARSRYVSWGVDPDKNLASIHAVEAWRKFSKKQEVVVAVIDTGIDFSHPFLKENIYVVSGKITKDNFGVDFSQGNSFFLKKNPTDEHGHGTHISGIIKSVYPEVKLLSLKYYNPKSTGQQNLDATIQALKYAITQGVDIINYSGGGPEASVEELRVLKEAERKGILVVAAAGNERSNIDDKRHAYYPASYGLKNIITVASHDDSLNIIPSSNYGYNSVDVAAPGHRIRSTIPSSAAGYMTGTSQATAFVSGVAAMLKAQQPDLTAEQIKEIIKVAGISVKSFEGKVMGARKLDAERSLLIANKLIALQKEKKTTIRSISSDILQEINWGLKAIKANPTVYSGSNKVQVAVVDTGVNFNHEDLSHTKWINSKEKANKKDDDKNGYVDDISGYDFVTKSGIIVDTHGHGSHVAGIIAGKFKPTLKRGGVAPEVKISSYRYFINTLGELKQTIEYKKLLAEKLKSKTKITSDDIEFLKNQLSLKNSNLAIKLAIDHGAKVINYSGGGYEPDAEELQILKEANEKNVLVVVASGNGNPATKLSVDMDEDVFKKYYPCAYALPNIICVSSVDEEMKLYHNSNFGVGATHVSAPGEKIVSTLNTSKTAYGAMTGTSQATAFVSALVALVYSQKPELTALQVKAAIINSVDVYPHLQLTSLSSGVINVEKTLANLNNPEKLVLAEELLREKLSAQKLLLKMREISKEKNTLPEDIKNDIQN